MAEVIPWETFYTTLYKRRVDLDRRIIILADDINQNTYVWLSQALLLLENIGDGPITIRVNTDGGEVYECFAILELLRQSKCSIITEGYGKIMSCGVLILASGDIRYISEYATVMCHHISYGVSRSTNASIKNEIKHSDDLEKRFLAYLAKHTNMPYTHWVSTGKLLDCYVNAETAIEWGIADNLLPVDSKR